ncbi:N-acetyltransferase [Bacteroidia bacterium]|nr:N-acetyltransferase [Bacteroidia bacterium]
MEITRKDNGKNGVFNAVKDGVTMGEMTYFWEDKNTIAIPHTGVEPEFEGQGVGRALFDAAIKFARDNEVKIEPICPFVVALFERKPECGDVLA